MDIINKYQEATIGELRGDVYTITLNRPEVYNAFNLKLINELIGRLKIADFDKRVKMILIKGAGKAFCSGGDIKLMSESSDMFAGDEEELRILYAQGIQQIPKTFEMLTKPTVAVVHGAAVGAGCDLACMCDFRILSSKGFFQESFIKLGLVSGDGGSFFLLKHLPKSRVLEMMLTAKKITSSLAFEWGLANKVCEAEDLDKVVDQFCSEVCQFELTSIVKNKAVVQNASKVDLTTHLEFAGEVQAKLQRSDFHLNRVNQFLDKSQKS